MKIAIVGIRGIPANYGGFETCAEQTAMRFARKHQVVVYCRKHNCQCDRNEYLGIKLRKFGSINKKGIDTLSHTFLSVLDLVRQRDIRIVHLYNVANAIFIPFLKLAGKKVAVSVDGLEWKRLKWGIFARAFYKISEFICAKTADAIICDSKIVQRYYEKKFNCRTEYIPYGAQIDERADIKTMDKFDLQARKYLLFVGRLVPEKGVHNLIKAYNCLDTDMPLVIIGDDPDQKEYIAGLKKAANKNVRFLGFVYGQDYRALNQFPYLYVTASMLEGTSPALVAAMGAGNCVLVNGIAENLETIGQAGLAYRENDNADLLEKLKMLLNNPHVAERYRQLAYEHVMATYNWDAIAEKYLQLFCRLLGEPYNNEVSSCMVKTSDERRFESVGD